MSLTKVYPLMEQIPLSGVLGGTGVVNHLNSFTIGSNLSSTEPNFVYVNNLSATNLIYGDGRYMKNVATLNPETQLISPANLPSYVDDVLEYTALSAFPVVGETGKIYVTLDERLIYRWTGTMYIEISKSAQPSAIGTIPNFTADYIGSSGTSHLYSREDHIHPPDTTRLALTGGDLSGKLTVNGSLSANGSVYSTGSLFTSGSLSSNGDLNLRGSLTMGGSAVMGGYLTVGEYATFGGALTAGGSVSSGGSLSAVGDLTIKGLQTVEGNITLTSSNSARYVKVVRDDGFEHVLVFGGTSTGDNDSSIHPFYALNGRGGPISPDYHQDNIRTGSDLRNVQYGDNTVSRNFVLSGTPIAPEPVGADKVIGGIKGFAYSGDNNFLSYGAGGNASIELFTDGLQSMENAGGYITLNTTPSSAGLAGGLQERMRIASNGSIYIGSNATTLRNATGITQETSNPTANSRMVNIHSCDGRALLVVSNETTSYNPSISIKGGGQPSLSFTHTQSGKPYWQLVQNNIDAQGYPADSITLRHVADDSPSPVALMTMLSTGEVGFGTTTPLSGQGRSIHVYNNQPSSVGPLANANVTVESVNRNAYFYAKTSGAGSQAGFQAFNSATNNQFGGFLIGSDGTTRFTTGSAVCETMRIAPTGDIAIGTVTPSVSARLTVAGSISAKDFLYGDGRYIPNVILNRFGIDQSTQNTQGSFVVGINALPNEAANSTPVLNNVSYTRTVTTLSLTVGPSHGLSVNDYIKISNAPEGQIELNGVFRIIGVDTSVVYVENPTTSILSGNTLTVQKSLRNNVAIGQQALNSLTSGTNNLAIGFDAATGTTTSSNSVAIGNASSANGCGTAVGQFTNADSWGAAVGTGANANSNGVAVGYNAVACNGGVAIGRDSNTANYSGAIALGRESFATDKHLAVGSPGFPVKSSPVVCGRVMEVNLNGTLGYLPVYNSSLSALPLGGSATDSNKLPLSGGTLSGNLNIVGANLGIGTSTPETPLHVNGNGVIGTFAGLDGNYNGLSIRQNCANALTTKYGFIDFRNESNQAVAGITSDVSQDGSSGLQMFTTGAGNRGTDRRAEAIRITGDGKVGVGTSTPNEKMSISGNISASCTVFAGCTLLLGNSTSTTTGLSATLRLLSDYSGKNFIQSGANQSNNSAAPLVFSTMWNGTEWARFDTSGNFGIGTNTPGNKLDVKGTISANYGVCGLGFYHSNGQNSDFKTEITNNLTTINNTAGSFAFATANTEKVRITTSGDMGVGTCTPISASGYTSLTINSATSGGRVDLQKNGTQYGLLYSAGPNLFDVEATGSNTALRFNTNLGERMRISHNGNIGIGTSTPETVLHVNKLSAGHISEVKVTNYSCTYNTGTRYTLATNVANHYGIWEANVNSGTPTLNLASGDGNTGGLYFTAGALCTNQPIYFRQGDCNRLAINQFGNIGIGTNNPPSRLTVVGSSELGLFSGTRDANGFAGIRIENTSTTSQTTSTLDSKGFFDFSNGAVNVSNLHTVMCADGSANLYLSTTPAGCKFIDRRVERVVISGSGNVGIGASLPNERLTIGGSISATGDVCINGKFRGDGSLLTGICTGGTCDTSKLPLSGGTLTGTLIGTTICATNLCGTHYGSGANLTGVLLSSGGTLTGTLNGTTICATNLCGTHYGSGANLTGVLPSSGGTLTGTLNGTTICATNLCGTHYGSGANLTGTVDSTKLPLAGGTITGSLTINGGLNTGCDLFVGRSATNCREGGQINLGRTFDNAGAWGIDVFTDAVGVCDSRFRIISPTQNVEFVTVLSSGNVGVGTAGPLSKLHVVGDVRIGNGNYLYLSDLNDSTRITRDAGCNGMALQTNSLTRLFVGDDGNVGIGTCTPGSKLQVSGDVCATNFYGSGAFLTNLPSSTVTNSLVTTCFSTGNTACYALFTNNLRTSDSGNTIDVARYSALIGGSFNSIRGSCSTSLAGPYQYPWDQYACSSNSAILGGFTNSLSAADNSAIIAGNNNIIGVCNVLNRNITSSLATNSIIAGGRCHLITGDYSAIIGGQSSSIGSAGGSSLSGIVVLGSNINGTVSDTVYTNNLNINGVVNDGPIDSLAPNIVTLIQANEANGSTSISDLSLYQNSYSLLNGAVVSNTAAKFGGTSVYINGSATTTVNQPRIRTLETDVVNFKNKDFTIEFWVNLTSSATGPTFFDTRPTSPTGNNFIFSGHLALYKSSNTVTLNTGHVATAASYTFNTNTWTHIAIVRRDFVTKVYIDGSAVITVTGDYTNYTGNGITFGAGADSTFAINGYLDEIIVTKNVARYSANFTPATVAYTIPSETIKLPYIDANSGTFNTFVSAKKFLGDGSDLDLIPYTITQSISTTDSLYTPNLYVNDPYEKYVVANFATEYVHGNSSYYRDLAGGTLIRQSSSLVYYTSAVTRPGGGSTTLRLPGRYDEGYGAYGSMLVCSGLSALKMLDQDYTFEAWIYPTSYNSIVYIADGRNQGTNVNSSITGYTLFALHSSGGIMWAPGNSAFTNTVCPISAWSHVVMQRKGGLVYAFRNGVPSPTVQNYPNYIDANGFTIGNAADYFGAEASPGGFYLDGLRITKGVARYPVEGFEIPLENFGYNRIGGQVHFANSITESKLNPSIVSNVLTIDTSLASVFTVSLNSNITTMNFTNPPVYNLASSFVLQFVADGTARTVAWPSSVKWPSGMTPSLNSTAGKIDTFTFLTHDSGATWYGFVMGQNH